MSSWWTTPLMLSEFLRQAQGFMRTLRSIAPDFGTMHLVSPMSGRVPLEVDHPDFLLQLCQLVPDPKVRYAGTDENGCPTMSSTTTEGFMIAFECGPATDPRFSVRIFDGPRSMPVPRASAMVKSIRSGDAEAEVMLEEVLCASVEFWRPGAATLTTSTFKASIRRDTGDDVVVGWRTYLGRRGRSLPTLQLVTRHALPRSSAATVIPPGGVLVGLAGRTFDPFDHGQIAEAYAIRDGLRPHGLLELPKDADTIGRASLVTA
jgi:hypothetical protein